MPGHSQHAVDDCAQQSPRDSQQYLFLGTALQVALRIVLIVFAAVTLVCEPPNRSLPICVAVLALYAVLVGCWGAWALRTVARTAVFTRMFVTIVVLAADVAVVSVLSVLTGLTSHDDWTSNVMRNGFFLIPLIAAAQLDPVISGVLAIPTLSAFIATCWITQASNYEPWASIFLSSTVLAGLAGGSVALSLIQRSKVETITELAQQQRSCYEICLEWKSMSGRRFPNACTTAPFSTFWLRARTWRTYGTARRSPRIGCSWPLSSAHNCCVMWSANCIPTCWRAWD